MGENNSNFALMALVAIVAVVGIVVIFLVGGSAKTVVMPSYGGNSMMGERGNLAGQMSAYCGRLYNNIMGVQQMMYESRKEVGSNERNQLQQELNYLNDRFVDICMEKRDDNEDNLEIE